MTIGYYAIPAAKRPDRQRPTLPLPYCRPCAAQAGRETVIAIDERAHTSLKCRGCQRTLRQWP